MKRGLVALSILAAVGTAASAHGQFQPPASRRAFLAGEARIDAKEQALNARKADLAKQVLQAREDAMGRGVLDSSFQRYWTDKLVQMPLEQLESLAYSGGEGDLNLLTGAFRVISAGGFGEALGDSSADLVFTKVTPCRIVDTRLAGGPLSPGSTRDYEVVGTTGFEAQGGQAGGCGIPLGATGVAINLVAVAPAGEGWLRAYPWAQAPVLPTASVINYVVAVRNIANGYIQPICDPATTTCTYDVIVRADAASTHLVADVTGYFTRVNKDQYRALTVSSVGDTTVAIGTGCTSYMSVTIDAPVAGRVVLDAHVNFEVYHVTGTEDEVDWGISTGPTTCGWSPNGSSYIQVAAPLPTAAQPDNRYMMWDDARLVVDVTAGSHTYYITGLRFGAAVQNYFYGFLTATLYPQ